MKKILVPNHHLRQKTDGTWEKQPGRIKMSLHLKSESSSDREAKSIVKNPNLSPAQKEHASNRLAKFLHSHEKLKNHVYTPLGDVDISEDSTELRSLWHEYLFTGRELIDEIGYKMHFCLKLKEQLSGLNEAKFSSLEAILNRGLKKRDDLSPFLTMVQNCRKDLEEFIALRNREKEHNDTLVKPPIILAVGIPSGGLILNRDSGKKYVFTKYLTNSFSTILGFVIKILGEN